ARPGDDDRTRTLRGLLLQAAALLAEDEAAVERAGALLEQFLADAPSLDPSLASPALLVMATLGDTALHDRLTERFRADDNPQDRERLLLALSRFRDAECLGRTLALSLSGDVRTQDAPYLLRETLTNRDNGADAWAFVSSNWEEIERRFPANSLSRLVSGVRQIRDPALALQVAAFLAAHPIPQGGLQVRQHVERMAVTVALAERESARLAAALVA
ncbi:MAG TPA: ERAP1-like C-terminal domain-containing protein, partial [Acidimicrobiales bacterium]|nr:ERAP1-like C-terminal domain-containing protein [Acidimicrobiales bacterium]